MRLDDFRVTHQEVVDCWLSVWEIPAAPPLPSMPPTRSGYKFAYLMKLVCERRLWRRVNLAAGRIFSEGGCWRLPDRMAFDAGVVFLCSCGEL